MHRELPLNFPGDIPVTLVVADDSVGDTLPIFHLMTPSVVVSQVKKSGMLNCCSSEVVIPASFQALIHIHLNENMGSPLFHGGNHLEVVIPCHIEAEGFVLHIFYEELSFQLSVCICS